MKQITVSDENGKKYTLEFTKNSIIQLERAGFRANQFEEMPFMMTTLLVRGAFKAHHADLSNEKMDKIFESLENKNGLLEKLAEMYAEHAEKLVEEGNVGWESNW